MAILRTVVATSEVFPEASALVIRTTGLGVNDTDAATVKGSGEILHLASIVRGIIHAQGRLPGTKKKEIYKRDGSEVHLVVPRKSVELFKSLKANGAGAETLQVFQAIENLIEKLVACGVKVTINAHDGGMGKALKEREELIRKEEENRGEWNLPDDLQQWVDTNQATIVYTDASSVTRTGFSAWAWWVDETRNASGVVTRTSSGLAEQMAIGKALAAIEGPVLVVADNVGLPSKDTSRLRTKHSQSVYDACLAAYEDRVRIHFTPGHKNCPGNVMVDALAGRTCKEAWLEVATDPEKHAEVLNELEAEKLEMDIVNAINAANWLKIHSNTAA